MTIEVTQEDREAAWVLVPYPFIIAMKRGGYPAATIITGISKPSPATAKPHMIKQQP